MGHRVKLSESILKKLQAHVEQLGRDPGKPQDIWDADVRGLVVRREPTGRMSWFYQFKLPGRRSRVKIGQWPDVGVEVARKAAMRYAGEVALGRDPVAQLRDARDETKKKHEQARKVSAARLGVFVDGAYRDWAETHLRSHRETLRAIKTDFAHWWSRPMTEIAVLDLERWRRSELARGLKKSTVNRAWERLRAVLRKAHEWRVIEAAPPKLRRFRIEDPNRIRLLTDDERRRLYSALEARERRRRDERCRMIAWQLARHKPALPEHGTYTDYLVPLVMLLLGSGLRRGEAFGLCWSNVNLDKGTVRVLAATSKSGRSREVPIAKEAREALSEWRSQCDVECGALVFPSPTGGRLTSVKTVWTSLMKMARIKDFRLHDCRHDFASRLAMAGVDLLSISKLLGHSSTQMTERYAHLSPNHLSSIVAKLDVA